MACCDCKDARDIRDLYFNGIIVTLLVGLLLIVFSHYIRTKWTGIPILQNEGDTIVVRSASIFEAWGPASSLRQRLGLEWIHHRQPIVRRRPKLRLITRRRRKRESSKGTTATKAANLFLKSTTLPRWLGRSEGESAYRPVRPTSLPVGAVDRRHYFLYSEHCTSSSSEGRDQAYDLSLRGESASSSAGPTRPPTVSNSASSTRPAEIDQTASKSWPSKPTPKERG